MHNDAHDNEFPPSIISGLQVNQLKTAWQTALGDILRKSGPVVHWGWNSHAENQQVRSLPGTWMQFKKYQEENN